MNFVLSHKTMAFATHIPEVRKKLLACKQFFALPSDFKTQISEDEAEGLLAFLRIQERLCGLVSLPKNRTKTYKFFTQSLRADTPSALLVPIFDGLYALRPEYSFLQMASELSFLELIRYGYDLCGRYIPGHGDLRTIYKTDALTSVRSIERFLDKCDSIYGCTRARRALKYVKDNSASPMESILSTRFALPFSKGGYNMPGFVLNERFERLKESRYPDLFWQEFNIDMEYNSEECHKERTRDAIRENHMQAQRIKVLTVTPEIAYSYPLMDRLAENLYQMAGRRYRPKAKNFNELKWQLHDQLLAPEWYKKPPEGLYKFVV